jgi:hypothetical protein
VLTVEGGSVVLGVWSETMGVGSMEGWWRAEVSAARETRLRRVSFNNVVVDGDAGEWVLLEELLSSRRG